jgi:uncharacterized protein (UPF0276 family)
VVASGPSIGWLEIHPENFLANPHALELLIDLSHRYRISAHTVGVSIGSATEIDRAHLKRVRELIDKIDPVVISGHLAWSTHEGEYLNDLLPLPYNEETLRVLVDHIHEVQDRLGRPYLVKNPSSYVGYRNSTMTEPEFLCELARRAECRLLCDVSNICLSAHNMCYDAHRYIDGLPAAAVGELHLGGFSAEPDEANPGFELLVDTHATRVDAAAWDLYAYALQRFGRQPTLIEWDNDIPALSELLNEAAHAEQIAETVFLEVRDGIAS